MFGMGPQELIIILILALVFFGPKKLPEIGRSVGQGMRELKRASREVMDSLDVTDDIQQVKESIEDVSSSDRSRPE